MHPSQWRLSPGATSYPIGLGARFRPGGRVSRPIYWTPSSYSAAPKEAASRFDRKDTTGVFGYGTPQLS
ncbi:uncharacterized protein K441DRAFT_668689 [Cenococcum geophilum 1.58]|uniref:uncharacterized protein n=1 Tax=Cenococcum geophilum 1.58 TaxID=794803 RepID=UPI00358DDC5C|nr:hypothetical protein K441DRAFT_668689 [Cenococcum geophilum 1.58]